MTTVFYDDDPWQEVQGKKWSRKTPRHYLYCIRQAAQACGMTAEPFRATLGGDGIYFTWRPSLKKILSAPRFKLVFLTFGVPTQTNGWRRHVAWLRFLFVCLLASEVHAMDERTYRYLRSHRFIRRKLHRAMPLVDVAFFETERAPSSFLLVVGDADRDEAVVDRLAESFDIVRVSTSKKSDGAREAANPRVRFLVGIDYEELKALYAGAAALIMPISTNRHAAGTTTVTEAVSAGCPVISNSISQWYDFRRDPRFSYDGNITVPGVRARLAALEAGEAQAGGASTDWMDLPDGIAYLADTFRRLA